MGQVAITGKDVVTINGKIIHDYADADCGKVVFDEDLMKVKASKDGNTIYGLNENGRVATMTLRLIMGGKDDKYFNSLLASLIASPSDFVLMAGSLVKRAGDGQGNTASIIYQCVGGVVKKQPEATMNAEGDPKQAVVEWVLIFGNVGRAIM